MTDQLHGISAADIAINEKGEMTIANPELVKKLQAATSGLRDVANADNYVGCGGNAYQCGKTMELQDLIATARAAKLAGGPR